MFCIYFPSQIVTDLLVYRRNSDKVAFFFKIIVSNKMSPLYHARLIVGMLINYFTCIALKIIVLEMIALIKKWPIKCLAIRNFIRC